MDKSVGVIGLGIMGGAIAGNLVARGWKVTGYDVDADRRAELSAVGVAIAGSVAEVAAKAPVLITSLPSPAAVARVAAEIAASNEPRRIVIEASTLALDDKFAFERVLAAAGHVALDCPLSGTGAQAKTRDLIVYASGDAAAIAEAGPVFADFAREAANVGVFGNGSRMKFVANLLVAIHNVASAEAMVLAMKAGLDPHQVVKLVSAGAGTSRVFDLRASMMADAHYEPATMRVSTWKKDMKVIGDFARSLDCPTPLFTASEPVYTSALSHGLGDKDTAAVCAVLEHMAALDRPAAAASIKKPDAQK